MQKENRSFKKNEEAKINGGWEYWHHNVNYNTDYIWNKQNDNRDYNE